MPWKHEWVDPELAFKCSTYSPSTGRKTIRVYLAYKDDNWAEPLDYHYTLHDGKPQTDTTYANNRHGIFDFDIRDFPTYHDDLTHQHIMQLAIDRQLCTIEDVMIYIQPINRGSNATQ